MLYGCTADADIGNYKNCTGLSDDSLDISLKSSFSEIDYYKYGGNYYSVLLRTNVKDLTECIVVNNTRKIILDVLPSIVEHSCSGQWDDKSTKPIWVSDIGGGKDGVEHIYYSSSDRLKQLDITNKNDAKEIYENIECQLDTYVNFDALELNDSAYYLYKMGLYRESIVILNRVIKIDPKRTVAYLNLGDAYLALHNHEISTKYYSIYYNQMKSKKMLNKVPIRVVKNLKIHTYDEK